MRYFVVGAMTMTALVTSLNPIGVSARAERSGQQAGDDTSRSAFEVASVKLSRDSRAPERFVTRPGGYVDMANMPLSALLTYAYQVKSYQIAAMPSWVATERFTIQAKAEGNPNADRVKAMVRTLLAERFQFLAHDELRLLPVYVLMDTDHARRRGLTPRIPPCTPGDFSQEVRPDGLVPCGGSGFGPTSVRLASTTMPQLAELFSNLVLKVQVVDRTGLAGSFDVNLTFSPPGPSGAPERASEASLGEPPPFVVAVEDQLGLRLESRRALLNALVIDRVARPTED